jgi:hypothetical protein
MNKNHLELSLKEGKIQEEEIQKYATFKEFWYKTR